MKETHTNLPPGPRGLPILGNLLEMKEVQHSTNKLSQWSKDYGKVVKLKLGQHFAFVLSGYDVIKEAFLEKGEHFSERPGWSVVEARSTGE